jgi:hypothetical protein
MQLLGHLLLIATLSTPITAYCTDQLSCFKSKLFNFNFPPESIHSLTDITNTKNLGSINIMAYGDFNNDLQ